MNPSTVRAQIEGLTALLVECSLCDEQNFPAIINEDKHTRIGLPNNPNLSIALKSNVDYRDIYQQLDKSKAFNFRMLDGALVQLLYEFEGQSLCAHRLAYFPSPSLEPFQNDPEIYELDEVYAD
ncbi:DUF2290 domain-containing protein, partial [Frateuria sp.]|uniref:DUF2290 domain-containing protein n=1 Tax=Frateuria sp. TaxID=2211372 RepID=UPI003F821BAF